MTEKLFASVQEEMNSGAKVRARVCERSLPLCAWLAACVPHLPDKDESIHLAVFYLLTPSLSPTRHSASDALAGLFDAAPVWRAHGSALQAGSTHTLGRARARFPTHAHSHTHMAEATPAGGVGAPKRGASASSSFIKPFCTHLHLHSLTLLLAFSFSSSIALFLAFISCAHTHTLSIALQITARLPPRSFLVATTSENNPLSHEGTHTARAKQMSDLASFPCKAS